MQKLLKGVMAVLLGATAAAYAQVERLPAGTNIEIRTDEAIDLRDASDGRIFSGSVARDVFDQNENRAIPQGVGAIAGGGKGAAIGAAAGAVAGAGTQVATRGSAVWVPAESILTFRLNQPLRVVNGPDNGYMRDGRHYHNDYDRYDPDRDRRQ
jgi:hypothetical protein